MDTIAILALQGLDKANSRCHHPVNGNMASSVYLVIRTIVGLYFLYWGLNGFFQWKAIPPNALAFESFIARLHDVPGLMSVVKLIEIGAGSLLVLGIGVPFALLALAPLVLVITLLHLILNFKLGWSVALQVFIPFAILVAAFLVVVDGA